MTDHIARSSSPPGPPGSATDSELEALWAAVLERWDDARTHAELVERCRQSNKLGFAAKRYRELARRDQSAYRSNPERSEEAQRRLDSIVTIAFLNLENARTDRTGAPKPWKFFSLLVITFLIGLIYTFGRGR